MNMFDKYFSEQKPKTVNLTTLEQCELDMHFHNVNSDLNLIHDALVDFGCSEPQIKTAINNVLNINKNDSYRVGNILLKFI